MGRTESLKERSRVKLILRVFLNGLLALVSFGIPLFLSAGTLRFWNAWLFLGIFDVAFLTILLYLALKNPEYAEKRLQGSEREKPQQVVMTLLVSSAILTLVVAGLDHRLHWSFVPLPVVVLSAVVVMGGFVMLFFAVRENAYGSRVIEIQQGQKVIDSGMYSVVRHPMYLAFLVAFCLSPTLLGSWFALIPVAFLPILVSFRIRNEERVLLEGLKGYDAYVIKVRYRLLPFIW